MPKRHLWKELNQLSEAELRVDILLPLLQKTPGLEGITDVHGRNEAGLDIIFFTSDAIRRTCYGLQLKKGNIGGGAKEKGTVEEVLRQLKLAAKFKHPVATGSLAGEHRIERFVVATSGNITEGARREIAGSVEETKVEFWDGHEIMRRIHLVLPELLTGVDIGTLNYLKALVEACDVLEALDQIQAINKRTLTQIFEEPSLRRKYASPVIASGPVGATATTGDDKKQARKIPVPTIGGGRNEMAIGALLKTNRPSVIIGDQNDGKTSVMRMLAIRRARAILGGSLADHEDKLPVLVRAKDVLSRASVKEAIAAGISRLEGAAVLPHLDEDLEGGGYIVFVDGFSELTCETDKERCGQLVEAYQERYSGAPVIVAGRPADFLTPKYFTEFHHFTIVAFSDKQVVALAKKYSKGIGNGDVTNTMLRRVKDALQLPGSPIPAIIGVMVYDEEQRYITNTAEAVDAYMTIRLGRYSREMGIRQEVEWSRKEDLLAEAAFQMVEEGRDVLTQAQFIALFDAVFNRLGEVRRGALAVAELVESGVLIDAGDGLRFHRTAFRDFFAGKHVFHSKGAEFDKFFAERLFDKRWGQVLMFAAGLRRHNSELLRSLNARVRAQRKLEVTGDDTVYRYGAYLLGRILTNSEASDATPRLEVIRTCLDAANRSLPEFVASLTNDLGPIGEIAALIGVEQTFSVTVGVPWLALQFKELALDEALTEEERYMVMSVFTSLHSSEWFELLSRVAKNIKSPRVLLVLFGLVDRMKREPEATVQDKKRLEDIQKGVLKSLKGHGLDVRRLLKYKSKVLEMEVKRLHRLNKAD